MASGAADCSIRAGSILCDVDSNQVRAPVAHREIAMGLLQAIAVQVGETRGAATPARATRVQVVGMEPASVIGAPLTEVDLETRVPWAAVRGDLAGRVHVPAVRAAHRA